MGRMVGCGILLGLGYCKGKGKGWAVDAGRGKVRWVVEGLYNGGTRSRVGRVGKDGMRGQQHTMTPPAAAMAAWLTALLYASCPKALQAQKFTSAWPGWAFIASRMHCRSGCV